MEDCTSKRGASVEPTQGSPKRRRLLSPAPLSIPLQVWTPAQVKDAMLLQKDVPDGVAQIFQDHKVEGRHLLEMSCEDLKKMGVEAFGTQQNILDIIKSWSNQYNSEEKVFNDPIHGHIELHPLMVKIIDTPQFQRLRYIKQLGGGYYVFMGASHNRFEHSIGVGYLAGELVDTLDRKQPELHISYQDILCVKIAGLCHDLGHGPFSHMFDNQFIPKVKPESSWKHEHASVMMFEHLLEENHLHIEFQKYGLTETDILFIKEQIAGPLNSEMCSQPPDWPYRGRPEDKSFLYEIVANKRNGIDVDKWDYFARDCYCLGIPNSFDLRRYMRFARVMYVNSRRQICTRDKEVGNLYEMFHTRAELHRRAYQHKTSRIIEYMITDALCKADQHFLFPGKNGKPTRMSDAIDDPFAYTRLTDSVLQQIMLSTDPNLRQSQEILLKVERRQLYKFIGQTQREDGSMNSEDIKSEIFGSLDGVDSQIQKDDFVVQVVIYDYGMKAEDPIKHMRFYGKQDPTKAVKVRRDQVSLMLPQTFREEKIRVYCKRPDQEGTAAAKRCFMAWCQKYACITPKGVVCHRNGEDSDAEEPGDSSLLSYATPLKDTSSEDIRPSPVNVKKNLQF